MLPPMRADASAAASPSPVGIEVLAGSRRLDPSRVTSTPIRSHGVTLGWRVDQDRQLLRSGSSFDRIADQQHEGGERGDRADLDNHRTLARAAPPAASTSGQRMASTARSRTASHRAEQPDEAHRRGARCPVEGASRCAAWGIAGRGEDADVVNAGATDRRGPAREDARGLPNGHRRGARARDKSTGRRPPPSPRRAGPRPSLGHAAPPTLRAGG